MFCLHKTIFATKIEESWQIFVISILYKIIIHQSKLLTQLSQPRQYCTSQILAAVIWDVIAAGRWISDIFVVSDCDITASLFLFLRSLRNNISHYLSASESDINHIWARSSSSSLFLRCAISTLWYEWKETRRLTQPLKRRWHFI